MKDNDFIEPFGEEFDESDVVNRGDLTMDFFEEFDKKDVVNPKNKQNESLISKELLADIVSDGENLIVRELEEKEEFFGVIKKHEIDSGAVTISEINHTNDALAFDVKPNIEEDFNQKTPIKQPAKYKDELRPEEEIEQYLLENFRDFMALPKVSGTFTKSIEHNLIPKDIVYKTGKTIEIADNLAVSKEDLHNTSVIINRDEAGELESLEVICKCGERTMIKFDYITSHDLEKNLTEIEDEPIKPIPLDQLKQDKEDVMILHPDLVNPPRVFDETEEIAETDEDEEYDDFDFDDYDFDEE